MHEQRIQRAVAVFAALCLCGATMAWPGSIVPWPRFRAGVRRPHNVESGRSGHRRLVDRRRVFGLGQYTDYKERGDVVGTGAIAVDDIEIRNEESGVAIAMENAEPSTLRLAQAFLPIATIDRGFWVAPAVSGT
jgi:hypothetical protein